MCVMTNEASFSTASQTKKLVWDTSALLNIKEPDRRGYSPAGSLFKDFRDGWVSGPYLNIFPAIAFFELQAAISRKHRDGAKILREYYLMGDNEVIYNIDANLISLSAELVSKPGFGSLRGADLIFACIARIENAYLITLDNHFKHVERDIRVVNLNDSKTSAEYRYIF
jgi:predicted nucleic acid-binding protein